MRTTFKAAPALIALGVALSAPFVAVAAPVPLAADAPTPDRLAMKKALDEATARPLILAGGLEFKQLRGFMLGLAAWAGEEFPQCRGGDERGIAHTIVGSFFSESFTENFSTAPCAIIYRSYSSLGAFAVDLSVKKNWDAQIKYRSRSCEPNEFFLEISLKLKSDGFHFDRGFFDRTHWADEAAFLRAIGPVIERAKKFKDKEYDWGDKYHGREH